MTSKPTPEILMELRRTCEAIARTRNLPAEQAEELYCHMEDKALAYLAGDEPLSGEDIVLLVREHFGSPENLDALLGQPPTGGYHGIWHALNQVRLSGGRTDLWGILHFPWYGPNVILFPLGWFVLGDLAFLTLLLLKVIVGLPVPVWSLGVVVASGMGAGVLSFFVYRSVATRLTRKRVLLRRNVSLETEGILVRGMTESPAIVQNHDAQVIVTPLLGEQLRLELPEIRHTRQTRFCNGTLYLGDNGAFALEVDGHPERIAIVVPRPGRWSGLFKAVPARGTRG